MLHRGIAALAVRKWLQTQRFRRAGERWTTLAIAGTLALPTAHLPNIVSSTDPRLLALQQAAPDLRLTTDPAELEHYGRDWTRRWTPAPLAMALPDSVEQVQAVVRWAHANAVAVVPSVGQKGGMSLPNMISTPAARASW